MKAALYLLETRLRQQRHASELVDSLRALLDNWEGLMMTPERFVSLPKASHQWLDDYRQARKSGDVATVYDVARFWLRMLPAYATLTAREAWREFSSETRRHERERRVSWPCDERTDAARLLWAMRAT